MSESHRKKKRFGQNFLHDEHIIGNIIHHICPSHNDHIVEIGPGLGALTQHLIPPSKRIDIIEIDRELIPKLQTMFAVSFPQYCQKINLHQHDALTFDFAALNPKEHSLRIVGNLPYNISTPLIFHLLSQIQQIDDMHFMLQKEVVDRISATTDNKHYGRLSIMMQYHCEVEKLFDVGPESFSPPPKVNSAIVKLRPYRTLPHPRVNTLHLEKLVAQAFSQRRKTIRNCLKGLVSIEQMESVGIDPKLRAENIKLEQYLALCNLIY